MEEGPDGSLWLLEYEFLFRLAAPTAPFALFALPLMAGFSHAVWAADIFADSNRKA
jgi:hypothetical protein